MDQYHKSREAILKVNQETASLIQQTETVLGNSAAVFEQWKRSNANIAQGWDHQVRIFQ